MGISPKEPKRLTFYARYFPRALANSMRQSACHRAHGCHQVIGFERKESRRVAALLPWPLPLPLCLLPQLRLLPLIGDRKRDGDTDGDCELIRGGEKDSVRERMMELNMVFQV